MSINELFGTGPVKISQTRVLLVDDDEALLELVGDHLELKGAKVDRVTSGAEAVRLLSLGVYDKVVCDSELKHESSPNEYGPQLVPDFRRLHLGEIIGTSSNTDPQISKDWQDGGATYCSKPIGLASIREYASALFNSSEPSLVRHYSF